MKIIEIQVVAKSDEHAYVKAASKLYRMHPNLTGEMKIKEINNNWYVIECTVEPIKHINRFVSFFKILLIFFKRILFKAS